MTTEKAVTRAEFERLEADLAETKAMVAALHGALMVAQPGHDRPLIQRMGAVVVGIESGDRAAKTIIKAAQIITAIGVLVGIVTFWRHGVPAPT